MGAKITIIGAGNVGSTIAFALSDEDIASEIVLIDINKNKVEGEAMWQRFNQKDVAEQAWYYRSIVKLTERLSNTSAWLEYKTLTELVFGKGE